MADGKPTGPAQLVRGDVRGVQPLGFAGHEFYFGVEVQGERYRAASIDFEQGRVRKLPTDFDVPSGGNALAWSPEGGYLVHVGQQGKQVTLLDARGKALRHWTFDLRIDRYTVKWMPDRSAVLLPGTDAKGRQGFIRVDLASGSLEMVRRFIPDGETTRELSISPDGRTLYFVRRLHNGTLDDSASDLIAHDFATGAERTIRPVSGRVGQLAGSPDGTWIAQSDDGYNTPPTIRLIPLDGSDTRVIARFEDGRVGIAGWSPDSKSLVFLRHPDGFGVRSRSAPTELWQAFRDGRAPRRIAVIPDYAGGLALHPNGRTIAYRSGNVRGEIWALDGLTPAAASDGAGQGTPR
jgi:Tol biopolymer transport system component